MYNNVPSYLNELPDWRDVIRDKFVIFDTDAIISIIEFNAEDLIQEFITDGVSCCTIHPVKVELMRTESQKKRSERQTVLDIFDIEELPLFGDVGILQNLEKIRVYLQNFKKYPSPTDLYLAGTISKYSQNNKTFLLTGNTHDFPLPLFKREAFVILQNKFTYKILTFLSTDMEVLTKFEKNIKLGS